MKDAPFLSLTPEDVKAVALPKRPAVLKHIVSARVEQLRFLHSILTVRERTNDASGVDRDDAVRWLGGLVLSRKDIDSHFNPDSPGAASAWLARFPARWLKLAFNINRSLSLAERSGNTVSCVAAIHEGLLELEHEATLPRVQSASPTPAWPLPSCPYFVANPPSDAGDKASLFATAAAAAQAATSSHSLVSRALKKDRVDRGVLEQRKLERGYTHHQAPRITFAPNPRRAALALVTVVLEMYRFFGRTTATEAIAQASPSFSRFVNIDHALRETLLQPLTKELTRAGKQATLPARQTFENAIFVPCPERAKGHERFESWASDPSSGTTTPVATSRQMLTDFPDDTFFS